MGFIKNDEWVYRLYMYKLKYKLIKNFYGCVWTLNKKIMWVYGLGIKNYGGMYGVYIDKPYSPHLLAIGIVPPPLIIHF